MRRGAVPMCVLSVLCWASAILPATAQPSESTTLTPPLANLQVIFGFYDRRFVGYNGGQEHAGVDFSAAAGTPVYAICDGNVALTRTDRAEVMSAVLVLEHHCPEPVGKVFAYYGHIHSDLQEGDSVSAGATIGSVRDWRANSHLHLGLSRYLIEDNWGTYPRGTSLPGLMGEGWLNPLNYFTAVTMAPSSGNGNGNGYRNGYRNGYTNGNGLKRILPKPPVHRQNGARNVPRKR